MALNTIADLSNTPASNTDLLGQSTSGTQSVSALDNMIRNHAAIMARFYADLAGVVTVGGSANAITVTSNSTYQTLKNGLIIGFKAVSANTGAATFNLDGLGAKAIRRQGDSALSANDIVADGIYGLRYDTSYNAAAGAWVLLNTGSGYAPGGTDVALADGGTGASLTDPNADRIMFWDDSAGTMTWLTPGTGLTITGTTIDATAGLTLGTPQSPSGVSSVDFTSIPSTAKQITISWSGLSSASNSSFGLQIGDSGGIETTGYTQASIYWDSAGGTDTATAGTQWNIGRAALANSVNGCAILTLLNSASNTWGVFAFSGPLAPGGANDRTIVLGGFKSTSAPLDRLRLSSGTGNFDAGSVNIAYI